VRRSYPFNVMIEFRLLYGRASILGVEACSYVIQLKANSHCLRNINFELNFGEIRSIYSENLISNFNQIVSN